MIAGKKITLITPCRNEEGVIGKFVRKVPKYIDEIIVVDNNSTDRSVSVARKAGARVLIEKREVGGIGYGFAHMRGLAAARGDIVVAMDADDTYPVRSIKQIVKFMDQKHVDFVSCNRLPLKRNRAISWVRQLGIHILNLETFLLYGYPIRDILTGMWVVRKETVDALDMRAGDWNFSPEIKLAALTNKRIRFAEYHIDHFQRLHEPSKQNLFRTGFMHMNYIAMRWATIDNVCIQTAKTFKRFIDTRLAY